jgi:glycosyltransferase involved in cell wall biosynthesis
MRSVLFISYFFPPAGGPGVQRVAKHVKFLREFGYHPIVVTATPDDYRGHSMWEMPLDESLAMDVPAETEIHRVASRQPFRLFAWLAKWRLDFLRELFFVPDTAVTWVLPAVKRARQIAQKRPIDLIYTSVRPHSVALIGWALKRLLGKPWVLDFRDPWTQYFLATFPSKLHYRFEQWLERFLLRRADHVITITPTARANLLAWCDFLSEEKVSCITNGYDEGDFDASRESDEKNGVFQLVYAGVFCGAAINGSGSGNGIEKAWRGWRRRLAYAPRRFDRLTHSPKFLLDAMCELFAERPDLRGRLKLVHVGPFDEANERYVRELGLDGAVEARGYVRHAEAVQLLKQADALFFCLADSPAGERNDCVPQKLYEYLGSRRPVLALAPAGDARDFLAQAQTAVICPPRDVRAIKEAMLSLVEGAPQFAPNEEFIQSFKRRVLTAQLAEIFDRVTAN